MASVGIKQWVCLSPVFASGGSAKVNLQEIPDGRLLGFLVRIKTNIVQAAGAALIPGEQLYRLIDQALLAGSGVSYFRTTGKLQILLNWMMTGRTPQMPQDVPANAGPGAVTYSRYIDCWLNFVDYQCESPLDTAIDAALVRDTSIDLNWGNVTALYGANTSLAATSVRCIAYYEKPKPRAIPAEPVVEFTNWASQSALLPMAGAISHCFVYDEALDVLSDDPAGAAPAGTQYFVDWTVFVDGITIVPKVQTGELIASFDYFKSGGVTPIAPATGTGGEQILDEPGVGAAAGQIMVMPFVPILFPPSGAHGYGIGHLPITANMLRIDWTGPTTSATFAVRRIANVDKSRIQEIARKKRLANPGQRGFSIDVAGGGTLTTEVAKVLPKQIQMTPEEIRARGGKA